MLRIVLLMLVLTACSEPEPASELGPEPDAETGAETGAEQKDQELNLSRDAITDVMDEEGPAMHDPNATLPNMFADEAEDKKTKLSGKVLTKEEAEDLRSTVDGVQVELEVPTR